MILSKAELPSWVRTSALGKDWFVVYQLTDRTINEWIFQFREGDVALYELVAHTSTAAYPCLKGAYWIPVEVVVALSSEGLRRKS